jgi:hypothetical protein
MGLPLCLGRRWPQYKEPPRLSGTIDGRRHGVDRLRRPSVWPVSSLAQLLALLGCHVLPALAQLLALFRGQLPEALLRLAQPLTILSR